MFLDNLRKNIKIYLIIAVILFPLNFGFINTDLSIYLKAGKTILDGGKIYVDFFDVKPPIFFTSYALINFLVNDNYRLFFILLYIVSLSTSIGIFHFVEKQLNRKIAIYTSSIYSLIIATIGFSMGMHFEVLFNFLIFLSIIFYEKTKSSFSNNNKNPKMLTLVIFGSILGYIFSSKYTFGLLAVAFLFYDILNGNYTFKNLLKKYSVISVSFILSTILYHFWLFDPEIFAAYREMLDYMSFYSSLPPISIDFFRDVIKNTGIFFGDNLSILFTVSLFIGIYGMSDREFNNSQKSLVLLNLFVFIFLLISVIIEKKMIPYHFARLAFPVSIVSGVGISYILDFIKKDFEKNRDLGKNFAIFSMIILLLVFSPLPRYFGLIRHSSAYFKPEQEYYKFLDSNRPGFFNYFEKYKLASYINSKYPKSTKVLICSIGSFDLVYQIKPYVFKQLPQRSNYLSLKVFPSQLALFTKLMQKADLLIIQRNDIYFSIITGSNKSSEQMIKENPTTNRLLESRFKLVRETEAYLLYESKDFAKQYNNYK